MRLSVVVSSSSRSGRWVLPARCVVASVEDYAAVRDLIADLVAEGVEATVKPEIREVVEATARLLAEDYDEVRQADLKGALKLDKSAISRRVAGALDGGFLKNLEDASVGQNSVLKSVIP